MAKTPQAEAEPKTEATAKPQLTIGEDGNFWAEDKSFYVEAGTAKIFRRLANGSYIWDGSNPETYRP